MSWSLSFWVLCLLVKQCPAGLSVWNVGIGAFLKYKVQGQVKEHGVRLIPESLLMYPQNPQCTSWPTFIHGSLVAMALFLWAKMLYLKVFIWKWLYYKVVWRKSFSSLRCGTTALLFFPFWSVLRHFRMEESCRQRGQSGSSGRRKSLTMFSLQLQFTTQAAQVSKSYTLLL